MKVFKKDINFSDLKLGGDFWNTDKLHSMAFKKYPDAIAIEYHLTTGLWTTVKFTFKDGTILEHRLFA